MTDAIRIGVLSDTHGKLPVRVLELFSGVQRILHAGDIGRLEILRDLETIAPVTAVWGNTDGFDIRQQTVEIAHVDVGDRRVVVLHGHQVGSPNPASLAALASGADAVVFGHSHRPLVERSGTTLFLNPGSAGAARFGVGASVAFLRIEAGDLEAEILPLG